MCQKAQQYDKIYTSLDFIISDFYPGVNLSPAHFFKMAEGIEMAAATGGHDISTSICLLSRFVLKQTFWNKKMC